MVIADDDDPRNFIDGNVLLYWLFRGNPFETQDELSSTIDRDLTTNIFGKSVNSANSKINRAFTQYAAAHGRDALVQQAAAEAVWNALQVSDHLQHIRIGKKWITGDDGKKAKVIPLDLDIEQYFAWLRQQSRNVLADRICKTVFYRSAADVRSTPLRELPRFYQPAQYTVNAISQEQLNLERALLEGRLYRAKFNKLKAQLIKDGVVWIEKEDEDARRFYYDDHAKWFDPHECHLDDGLLSDLDFSGESQRRSGRVKGPEKDPRCLWLIDHQHSWRPDRILERLEDEQAAEAQQSLMLEPHHVNGLSPQESQVYIRAAALKERFPRMTKHGIYKALRAELGITSEHLRVIIHRIREKKGWMEKEQTWTKN